MIEVVVVIRFAGRLEIEIRTVCIIEGIHVVKIATRVERRFDVAIVVELQVEGRVVEKSRHVGICGVGILRPHSRVNDGRVVSACDLAQIRAATLNRCQVYSLIEMCLSG